MGEFSLAKMLEEAAASSSSLDRVFSEEPVDLKTFINDKKYLGLTSFELSEPQTDLVRHIEQIYLPETLDLLAENESEKEKLIVGPYITTRYEPYWAKRYRMTNKITAMWGKGGGKDSTVRIGTLRVIYLLLCLKSPQLYYDMPDVDSIHTLNIASSAPQALRAFFDPIRRAVKAGWFADKCEPTKNQIEFDKGVIAISGHSQAESQEGLNLILGVADEIDAFASSTSVTAASKSNPRSNQNTAEYILSMMDSSASTRFPDIYKLVSISYPRYKGSPIMNLMEEARKDVEAVGPEKSTYYISGPYATWEVNPRVTGKDKFSTQYRKDPIEAAAKYECKPNKSANPYFRNELALRSCFAPVEQETIKVSYRQVGKTWEAVYEFHPDFKPIEGAAYAMHADLAIKGDRAGISMAHVKKWNEYETIVEQQDGFEVAAREMRPEVKVDFTFAYEADIRSDPPREIQIRWARQLCFELIKRGFPIRRFTYDQYQSADSMQILQAHGIESERVSTDRTTEVWRNLRDVIHDGRLDADYNQLLIDELLGLTQLDNGKVDHTASGSKDLADAFGCAVMGAIILGGEEAEGEPVRDYAPTDFEIAPREDGPIGTYGGIPLGMSSDMLSWN